MQYHYARGRIFATVILVTIFAVLTGVTLIWVNTTSNEKENYRIDFSSATLVEPVSIDGAGWQVKLSITNVGKRDSVLKKIYVNDRLITDNGYIHGDVLTNTYTIASSLPDIGLFIQPGRSDTVYLWVGSRSYEDGDVLTIELQNPNQIDLKKISLQ